METLSLPWVFAAVTAAWFGWMAARAGRTAALWAVGGAAFGLVASTIVIGLGRAVTIAYSEDQARSQRFAWIALAALLIAAVGWVLTTGLHRRRVLNEQARVAALAPSDSPAEPKPAAQKPKPPAQSA